MKKWANLLLSLLILTVLLSCEEEIPPPKPPELSTPKDPRTYTWTIDTIAYPGSFQTTMRDIWGSTTEDVWVVGHNDRGYGKMFRYNGASWTAISLLPIALGGIDLTAVRGFGHDDIFAVGERIYDNPSPPPNFLDSTLIIHFDGISWKEESVNKTRGLWDIEGTENNNLWAAGLYGAIYHFDGSAWTSESIPPLFESEAEWLIASIGIANDGTVYALANAHVNAIATDYYKFLARASTTWEVVDSFLIGPGQLTSKWGTSALWVAPSGEMYSCGDGVFIWDAGQWVKVLSTSVILGDISGSREDHIFAVGYLAIVYYFDGSSWIQLETPASKTWSLMGVWCNEDEVFVVGHDGYTTCVLHGE